MTTRTKTTRTNLMWILGLAMAAGAASPAMAQNAVGDGRGQERKTIRTYPKNDQPKGGRDFAAEVRFRNSIVTGGAPGGLSFRGNAPYSAPDRFRGGTGSEDLYSFRRDSFYSGLSGQGIRGTEALQYQFAMTTGSSAPRAILGTLGVARTGESGVTIARDTQPRDEVTGSDWIRSTASYSSSRALRPTALGERPRDEQSYYRLMSSPLLGLRVQKVDVPKAKPAVPPAIKPPVTTPDGTKPEGTKPDGSKPDGTKPQESPAKPKPDYSTSYDTLAERLGAWRKPGDASAPSSAETVKPGETATEVLPWERRVGALRRHLLGLPARDVNDKDTQSLSTDDAVSQLNPETLRMIRESGMKVPKLLEVPDARAALPLYAKAMAGGQQALAERRYFDAEDRFSRALAARPRDPSAQAGRVHSQLGAGMYLSASVNLRELLVISPETAVSTYDPAILPDPARLAEIIATLRTRLNGTEHADALAMSLGVRDVGFMLAYLGFHANDQEAIKQGLAAVASLPATTDDDKLAGRVERFLRAVWLGEMPTEMPAAPTPEAVETPKAETPATETPKTETPANTPPKNPPSK